MKFELEPYHRNVTDEELIKDLVRVSRVIKKDSVTIDEYNENGKYHATTLTRRFGSWFSCLKRASLKRTRNLGISNEQLFSNLLKVWLRQGGQPRYNDMADRNMSEYSVGTYEKRFGGWRRALECFVNWANHEVLDESIHAEPQTNTVRKRRTQRKISDRLRAKVLMRDGATCRLCGATPTDGAKLHIDHIKPWSKGGETVMENLQILCQRCNIGKSDLNP